MIDLNSIYEHLHYKITFWILIGKTIIAKLKIWLYANLETDMLNIGHKRLKDKDV